MVDRIKAPGDGRVRICVVGKYTELIDSYKSIAEALVHGGIPCDVGVDVEWWSSERVEEQGADFVDRFDGVLVPGGFGSRGVDGKLTAVRYARENGIPYFGICLGLQVAAIEIGRNVLGMKTCGSSEFDPEVEHAVIDLLPEQKRVIDKGATMRLGEYECELVPGTVAAKEYGTHTVFERHRHRYEFNKQYESVFENAGVVFSGRWPEKGLVEIMELPAHPWFVGCQFHPEFRSRPGKVHPLFRGFIRAATARAYGEDEATPEGHDDTADEGTVRAAGTP
jgi:CTP synthase